MFGWGFDASERNITDLFNWLDADGDGMISFEDLRSTAGQDITPQEGLYFRQDRKPTKQITCKYPKCWENNNFNSKSVYCQLHQKVMRNNALDKFSTISYQMNDNDWDKTTDLVARDGCVMKVGRFLQILKRFNHRLTKWDVECIVEAFRTTQNAEEEDDKLDNRIISL